jgi:Amt family ammonium transporter
MTPGLAFFYGGMVRAKHVLGMLMQNFAAIAIVSITWVVVGFSLAFSGENGLVGNLHFLGLANIDEPATGITAPIPTLAFVAFQSTFAIITLALITGATADRWRFGAFVVFGTIWSILVYSTVAHWVFSPGGWLFKLGALDFAGGTVVHINAGAAGLAMALVLGKRLGWPREQMRGHNIPFVMLGAGLLWFGWFGFNAGSALATNDGNSQLASFAWVNTNTATAAALIGWLIIEKISFGKSTALGAASGAVSGLVAITPCAGFVTPMASIAIGLGAGMICALAIRMKNRLGFDDSLDVVGVHLVGGLFGAICVGLFATSTANPVAVLPDGSNSGLFVGGDASLLGKQIVAAVSVMVFSFVVSFILGKLINMVMKGRVDEETEYAGLDEGVHGESAYEFGGLGGLGSGQVISQALTPTRVQESSEVKA